MKVKVIDDSAILGKIFHIWYEHKCSLCMLACSSYLSPPQALRLQSRAGELEARETGDEHARDHGKERGERRNACEKSCRFLGNFVAFSSCYFPRVLKP